VVLETHACGSGRAMGRTAAEVKLVSLNDAKFGLSRLHRHRCKEKARSKARHPFDAGHLHTAFSASLRASLRVRQQPPAGPLKSEKGALAVLNAAVGAIGQHEHVARDHVGAVGADHVGCARRWPEYPGHA